jgi:hypothetical protein
MKRSLLIGAVTVVLLAAFAGVGLGLIGARQQIGAIASALRVDGPARSGPAVAERAADAAGRSAQSESVRVARDSLPIDSEPAALPGAGFDPEAAIRAAETQDPGLAELLSNPDPAVGAAIRDFVTSIEPPGSH